MWLGKVREVFRAQDVGGVLARAGEEAEKWKQSSTIHLSAYKHGRFKLVDCGNLAAIDDAVATLDRLQVAGLEDPRVLQAADVRAKVTALAEKMLSLNRLLEMGIKNAGERGSLWH